MRPTSLQSRYHSIKICFIGRRPLWHCRLLMASVSIKPRRMISVSGVPLQILTAFDIKLTSGYQRHTRSFLFSPVTCSWSTFRSQQRHSATSFTFLDSRSLLTERGVDGFFEKFEFDNFDFNCNFSDPD